MKKFWSSFETGQKKLKGLDYDAGVDGQIQRKGLYRPGPASRLFQQYKHTGRPDFLIPRRKCLRCNTNVITKRISILITDIFSRYSVKELAKELRTSDGQASRIRARFKKSWPFISCPNCQAETRIADLTLYEIELCYMRDKWSLKEKELGSLWNKSQQAIHKTLITAERKAPGLKPRADKRRYRKWGAQLRRPKIVSPYEIDYKGPRESF